MFQIIIEKCNDCPFLSSYYSLQNQALVHWCTEERIIVNNPRVIAEQCQQNNEDTAEAEKE